MRPLPKQTGDGTYIKKPDHDGILKSLLSLNIGDTTTIADTLRAKITSEPVDDKTYHMERVIKLACDLPLHSNSGKGVTDGFINLLWNDLQHPPSTSLDHKYQYRQADGSFNNIQNPSLGAAGTSYARTVRPQTSQYPARPDPGVIFDTVLVRKQFKPHPTKISSMLFYLATIVIHDVFKTDRQNPGMNQASSYLDLSPLYGNNQDEQDYVRAFKDGKLKPDCFFEKRLLGFPPGVGVLLVMFNRWHNYIVSQLALINENGRFTRPADDDVEGQITYDNDLFQTGRLITCGLYINIVLKDYVRTILNLNRADTAWSLDPRDEAVQSFWGSNASYGTGNQVSGEFNLVYRWHTSVSERDAEWIENTYKAFFHGKDPSKASMPELMQALKEMEQNIPTDPLLRSFAGIKRNADGTLPDEPLVRILTESIKDVAGAFGANNTPKVMRAIEILLIIQTRKWNMASLNEFRAHFNLKKHETFEDINPDPEVANQLKHLYEHPDLVEMYPGLVFESAKEPMVPGSGLCPSFTTSRAVLADAVGLVRGDRFYTTDYTPQNLTNWGFKECNYDIEVDKGAVFYKLMLRAFPNHLRPNSVYAHFPFNTPWENEKIHYELGIRSRYDYGEPAYVSPPTIIFSYDAAMKVLNDKVNFTVTWGETISWLMSHDGHEYGKDFMLSGDGEKNAVSRAAMGRALYRQDWTEQVGKFYESITVDLLKRHSYKLAGVNTVDIVRDVINLAQAHFSAEVFCIPMKTETSPYGIFTEREVYLAMALVFACIFFDADPVKSFPLRQASYKATQQLGALVEGIASGVGHSGFFGNLFDRFNKRSSLSKYGSHMIMKLLQSGYGVKELVWTHILPTAGGMVANQAQLLAQCLDFYLEEENRQHWKEIGRLARLDTAEADELILRYFMEGARIRSSVGLYRHVQKDMAVQDRDRTIHLKAGDRILVNLVSASHDAAGFPHPEKVDVTRPMDSYIHYGWGPHQCIGLDASKLALSTMLKTFAKLENLRRAPGPQGRIKTLHVHGGFSVYLMPDGTSLFPFPTSMKVNWDDELPKGDEQDWIEVK
ncbi:MAG: hypothetical protein LQ340_000229 [Diploschistes diacapsis]|nr:MAG: hypothetical protein LQ340_000229 [Diploschistes diacapsis]